MVYVKSKKCIDCDNQTVYNKEGETRGLYCSLHKKEGMVNVKIQRKCLNCNKQAWFNVKSEKKPLYCFSHKKEGMLNLNSRNCIECGKQSRFNYPCEKKPLYCVSHKKEGMVNVVSRKCIECSKQPTFNKENEKKPLYCASHKKEGMVNVVHDTCKSEWCSILVQQKYDGYCLFCYIHLFPDKPITRNYKTKEHAVVDFVKSKFSSLSWVADKRVNGGCSKRRPDLLLDLGYQNILIEIDENQHIDYDCSCQNKRLMELSQDLGHRPIVFIRFNPDAFKKNNVLISSCWSYNQHGVCKIKKSKEKEWEERLATLEEQINYWINPENVTEKTIETIQLFYDI